MACYRDSFTFYLFIYFTCKSKTELQQAVSEEEREPHFRWELRALICLSLFLGERERKKGMQ
jgi:hypothetical protein